MLAALDIAPMQSWTRSDNPVTWPSPLPPLLPGLERLLDVRRTLGLRNGAHSLVKLMDPLSPVAGDSLSWAATHPNTPSPWPATIALTDSMPCCCAAPRASPWPIRAARRRWMAFSPGTPCACRKPRAAR